jgi:uncharacterized membrane protein YccC
MESSFQVQFTKLSKALHQSKDLEIELLGKCRELKDALLLKSKQHEVSQACKLEDDQTISSLRGELEEAVNRADVAVSREQAAKRLVTDLQQEIETLRARLAADISRPLPQQAPTESTATPEQYFLKSISPFEVRCANFEILFKQHTMPDNAVLRSGLEAEELDV